MARDDGDGLGCVAVLLLFVVTFILGLALDGLIFRVAAVESRLERLEAEHGIDADDGTDRTHGTDRPSAPSEDAQRSLR